MKENSNVVKDDFVHKTTLPIQNVDATGSQAIQVWFECKKFLGIKNVNKALCLLGFVQTEDLSSPRAESARAVTGT